MNKKLAIGIFSFLCLSCVSSYANSLRLGPVYTNQPGVLSLAITIPPGQKETLKGSDFQLEADNSLIADAEKVELFSLSGKPLALMLCVDVSRSINSKILKETQSALISLINKLSTKTSYKYGLGSIEDIVTVNSKLTENQDAIKAAISGLKIAKGNKTLLYQGISGCLNELNEQSATDYKVLLTISDGKDEGSSVKLNEVVELSKKLSIPIDAIGRGIIPKQFAESLRGMSAATSGQFIYPELDLKSEKKELRLITATSQIINDIIDNTWVVSFKYAGNAELSKLANPAIKFKSKDSIPLTGLVLQSNTIKPIAIDKPAENKPEKIDNKNEKNNQLNWETIKEYLPYILFALLFLLTLIFMYWILGKRKIPDPDPKPIAVNPIEPIFPKPDPIQTTGSNDVKRRVTEVGATIYSQQLEQNLPEVSLVITDGPLQGKELVIDKQQFQIGANSNNDLVLDEDYVSGSHARLVYQEGTLQLMDLHSRNGTFVNGEILREHPITLVHGDIVRIGNSTIKIVIN